MQITPSVSAAKGGLPFSNHYWTFQLAGWSVMALLSFLSLTVWYNPGQIGPAVHTLLQSILGILVSHPLRWIATKIWHESLLSRALKNGFCVVIASLVWTALRIQTFTVLTGQQIPAEDWGGWIFASVIVFGAWEFCYHALKYYRLSSEQRRLAAEAQTAALQAHARAQQEGLKRLEAEKLFRDVQLRMLKYQLNPHFFLNALNSVSALVLKDDQHGALDMLARIGDFLRVSLANPEEVQHTLDEELDAIELYLSIEKVRFGDRLETTIEVEDEAREKMVPSLLLQPLFENAIKFAVGERISPTRITFSARMNGDSLRLRVTDDGPGIRRQKEETGESGQGIGLANVRQRLESAYGQGFELNVANISPHGYSVEITIEHASSPSDAPENGKITSPIAD